MALQDGVLTVAFHPSHEPNPTPVELVEPRIVDVGAVKDDGRARIEMDVLARARQ